MIESASDNRAILIDNNGADRHLSFGERPLCLHKGF
jgi:hypothetical protein